MQLRNKCGRELFFDTVNHLYTVDGEEYESVTKRIARYTAHFDMAKVSSQVAGSGEYKEMSAEDVQHKWEGVRDNGIRVHEEIEKYLLNGVVSSSVEFKQFIPFIREFESLFPEFSLIIPEQRMFDPERKLAGTADFIAVNPSTMECIVADWKVVTNLDYSNGQVMKKPFDKLADTKYNKYVLQTNYYSGILEKCYGVTVVLKLIVVFNKSQRGFYYRIADNIVLVDKH